MQLERHRRSGMRATAEERALLEEHATTWLGSIAPIVRRTGLRFERGFVAACQVFAPSDAMAAELRDAPEWATIEELELRNDSGALGTNLRALRRLSGVNRSAAQLFARPAAFDKLVALGARLTAIGTELAACSGLPSLRELDIE